MGLYSENSWTFHHSKKTKNTIHWVMQSVGSVLSIAGTLVLFIRRPHHIISAHSVTGWISLALLIIAKFNGFAALWSLEVRKFLRMRPVSTRFFHNFVGIATFVIGECRRGGNSKPPTVSRRLQVWPVCIMATPTTISRNQRRRTSDRGCNGFASSRRSPPFLGHSNRAIRN